MSYTPTEWKSGDVITSENLNKLEQGVAAAGGGGGGGASIPIADLQYDHVEIGGEPYYSIDVDGGSHIFDFCLIDPAFIASEPKLVVCLDSSGVASPCYNVNPVVQSQSLTAEIATSGCIFSATPIDYILVETFQSNRIALIPNNGTYAAGTMAPK